MFNQNHYSSLEKLPEFLCEQEVDKLIDSVDNLRDKTILELGYATGARPKELRSIQISDIDFNTREIRVFGKNAHGAYVKERILLFTKRALNLIKQYLKERKPALGFEDVLFLNKRGEGLSAKELNDMVLDYVFKILHRKIERPNASYILRHSFATAMMNRGVDLTHISEYLGHENLSSVQVYTHIAIDHLTEIIKKCHPRENPKYIAPYCKEPEWPTKEVTTRKLPEDVVKWAKMILKKE